MKSIVKSTVVYFCLFILLSSCSISREYSRSELSIPNKYRDVVPLVADTIQLPIRSFFKDSVLISLIEQSLQKNNDVSVALLTLQQLEQAYKQARLSLSPTLDLSAGTTNAWLSKNSASYQSSGAVKSTDFISSLGLTWEVDIWRKASLQKKGALAAFFAQKENVSALKTRIIVQVAQAYYNLVALDEQLRVAKRNIELCDSTLAMIQLQYSSGLTNSLAVSQAKAQKSTAEMLAQSTLQNVVIQENAISVLCGNYPSSVARISQLSQTALLDFHNVGVPAMLLSRRPDVKAAEYNVVYACSKAGLAKAAMYPSFNLSASIGTNANLFNSWFNLPGSITKNIGVNLAQPLFQRKALRSTYNIAVLEQEKANTQFKQTVLTAVGEVSDALAKINFTENRIILVEEKREALSNATKDALSLFKNGMANYLEVISVQNNALQCDLEVINSKYDNLMAIIELYRAVGGWKE